MKRNVLFLLCCVVFLGGGVAVGFVIAGPTYERDLDARELELKELVIDKVAQAQSQSSEETRFFVFETVDRRADGTIVLVGFCRWPEYVNLSKTPDAIESRRAINARFWVEAVWDNDSRNWKMTTVAVTRQDVLWFGSTLDPE